MVEAGTALLAAGMVEKEKWAQQEHEQAEFERQPQRQLGLWARLVLDK